MAASESVEQPLTIVVQHRGRPGFLAGVLACIFGVLGIFVSGILFVPLAVICSIVGFWRGIAGKSAEGIGTSLLGGFLSIIGFAVSPTLWLFVGALILTHEIADSGPPATASAPSQQAEQDAQFASNLKALVQRMQRFDSTAEANVAALPAYSSQMQAITAKMDDYLRREQELRDDSNAAVTRGQLFVAINQGNVATDQLRIQVQPLESEFQATAIPFTRLVSLMVRNCRSAMHSNAGSNRRTIACRDVLEAAPAFTQNFRNLQSSLATFGALDARTRDAQQRLIEAAQAAE